MELFRRFWQMVNLKSPLQFFKRDPFLLTLNKGCHLAGCFFKIPRKIFLPSLTLNKGRRLWGCFREIFSNIFYLNAKRGAAPDFSEGYASKYTIRFSAVILISLFLFRNIHSILFADNDVRCVKPWLSVSPKS